MKDYTKHDAFQSVIRTCLTRTERFLAYSELRYLKKMLWKDEKPLIVVQGFYRGFIALLVATDRRLVLIDIKPLDVKVEVFSYERVDTVEFDTALIWGELNIHFPGHSLTMRYIRRAKAIQFCRLVNKHMRNNVVLYPRAKTVPIMPSRLPKRKTLRVTELLKELERLTSLRQSGALSWEEFEFYKKQITKPVRQIGKFVGKVAVSTTKSALPPFTYSNQQFVVQ